MKTLQTIVLGFIGVVALNSCGSDKGKATEAPAVQVEVYSPGQISHDGFFLSGEVTAKQTANISTRMMGYINKIHVKPGDRVAEGQLLVSISNEDVKAKKAQVQAMINEAEAAAQNAKKDYERFQTLHQKNSVSDKELENVSLQHVSMQSKVEMARQQLEEVNAMLSYTNIRAPFTGVVTQKMADEGSMANPGMPILVIEQSSELQVVASVPEAYIPYVKIGDSATIELKSINQTLNGKIIELSPSAYRTGGQYAMKLALDAKGKENVHSGMYVNIHLAGVTGQTVAEKVMLANSSIVYRDQLTGVYVMNGNNEASLRWVRLGKSIGDQVEILSGLKQDDKVVVKASGKLYNGVKVSVTQ